jgi:hypothetical protein
MIIGGAKFPPALCRAARAKGIDIFAGSGMSETGPIMTLAQIPPGVTPADADDDVRRRSHTGLPVPFVDLRVVDAEMRDVPRDGETQGEIVLRAPYLTQGYFKLPQASEELWAGGYLLTACFAVVAPDGAVQIVDRIKDIKTGGGGVVHRARVADLRRAAGSGHRRQGRKWGNGRWCSSSASPTVDGRGPRSPARSGRVNTRCPRSTASPSSAKSRRRASASDKKVLRERNARHNLGRVRSISRTV